MMSERLTLSECLMEACDKLRVNSITNANLDARLLLQKVCNFSHAELISSGKDIISDEQSELFQTYIVRRISGEPVHRILGSREFYGREFTLSDETLIPRPDTETLVEQVIGHYKGGSRELSLLEIGTGSGVIAVSLACEIPQAYITAIDISQDALSTAHSNAVKHRVDNRINFIEHDMLEEFDGQFDAIISNPPYIPSKDILTLSKEVQNHDPLTALDGGKDGLSFYRAIFSQAPTMLVENGRVFVEIGIGQERDVVDIAKYNGFTSNSIARDIAGIARVVSAWSIVS